MDKLNPVGQMAASYSEQPIVQALAQLIPGAGIVDTLLMSRAHEIAEERARVFFEELANGGLEFTSELVQSEDFIHKFVITAKAAANSRQREKIRRFAQLLQNSLRQESVTGADEYEEYLQIVEDLSEREYRLLCILERYERDNPFVGEVPEKSDYKDPQEYIDITKAKQFWDQFLKEGSEQLGVPVAQIQNMLTRIVRTGCYQTLISRLFFDKVHEEGKLTVIWQQVRNLVERHGQAPYSP